ncbi:histidine kinase [Salinibacterium sp. ZJ454]|uniref:sensor histidine kinase n=1 Tax=Salinibacterium sp. ZJ454 TaxID=2708339 RepID=UPI00141DF20B|nr:histidine kinase [Salinibacterium sp. ZJ454]
MKITRTGLSWWAPPVGGAIFFTLWVIAEAGRSNLAGNIVVFALFAVAIGCSVVLPQAAVGIVLLVPALQIVGALAAPGSTTWPTYLAAAVVAFIVANRPDGIVRYAALPLGALFSAEVAIAMVRPTAAEPYKWSSWIGQPSYPGSQWEDLVTLALAAFGIYVAAWGIGFACAAIRRTWLIGETLRAREVSFAETDFELRLAQDRARISRDVHDALAHSLAVIVSQAQGALALQPDKPHVAGESLNNIAEVGRAALVEVRRLVERIHNDGDVAASHQNVSDIPPLIARMREIGMDASLRVVGDPRVLTPSQQLAVYRIVQESVTNALKHGGPTGAVRVVLDWQGPGLALLVSSHGETPLVDGSMTQSRGIGIEGMKERAHLAGGWLTAATSPEDDTFLVTAFVPTDEVSATGSVPRLRELTRV